MKKQITIVLLFLFLINLASAITIFSDDFESGNLNAWNKTNVAGARNWTANQTNPFQGSWHAQSQPESTTEPASVLSINISTSNYQDISIFYYRRLVGIDAGDEFQMEWFNGTTWEILESTGSSSANNAVYLARNFNLSSVANNNQYFQIKFECTAGATSEYCRVDNVIITGSSIQDTTLPTVNIIAPRNNTITTSAINSFNATFSDNIALINTTYYLWNSTNSLINITAITLSGLDGSINLTITFPYEDKFTWNYLAADTSNNFAYNLTNFTILYDATLPSINYTIPTQQSGTIKNSNFIEINITASDLYLQALTIRLFNSTKDQVRTNTSTNSPFYINYLNLQDGLYFYNSSANDTAGNTKNLGTRNITIDTTPPSITILTESPLDPTTYFQNNIYQFNATITDLTQIQSVKLEFNGTNYTAANPAGNTYNVSISNLPAGVFNYRWFANDSAGNTNNSETGPYTINKAQSQLNLTLNNTEGNITIIASTSIILNGTLIRGDSPTILKLYKNSTLINEGLSPLYNLTNFTIQGLYNITIIYTSSQNYTENSKTYYVNVTSQPDITSPYFTATPANTTINYTQGFQVNFEASDNIAIDSFSINWTTNFEINKTGSLKNTTKLSAGAYLINVSINDTSDNKNSTIYQVIVNKIPSQVNTFLNHSRLNITILQNTAIYLNSTLITGEGIIKLYKNNSLINQGQSQLSNLTNFTTIGTFNITTIYEETQNYSSNFEAFYIKVTQTLDNISPYFTAIPADTTTSYPNNFGVDFDASDNNAVDNFRINWTDTFQINQSGFLNNTKNLGTGFYLINITINDTSNNLNSTIYSVNITQNNTYVISISLSPASSVIYPTQTTTAGNSCPQELSCTLFRNNISITNPEIKTLGAETYHYLYNTTGNTNYSSKTISSLLIINQNTSSNISLFLNNTQNNITIINGTSIDINTSLIIGTGQIELYKNNTLINIGNSSLHNLTLFNTINSFNITAIYRGNENHTSATKTFYVNVIQIPDTTFPLVSIIQPQNISYNTLPLQLNYSVSDNNLQSCWYSINNGITNTSITCGSNISSLSSNQNSNIWTIYANDSAGNINSSSVTFFVDSIIPLISFTNPTKQNNSILSQSSIFINTSINETNFANITFSLYNITSLVNMTIFASQILSINFTSLQDGVYFYNVTIKDTLNNQNTTETRTITLDKTAPSIFIISPQNITYFNTTILINISSNGNIVWFFNTTANETYISPVYRTLDGSNTIIAYTNDSLGNINSTSITFYATEINLNCEIGGPYQQGALVLVQGNLSNKTTPLTNQEINLTIYKNNLANTSKILSTSNDGSFETSITNLSIGNYILNATTSYLQSNKSCIDNFQIGSQASLIIYKIASVHNTTNDTIYYNITLKIINSGGADATNTNITDSDSESSPYVIGTLSPSSSYQISYLKNFSRQSSTFYYLTSAAALSIDSYSNSLITANSTQINLTVPATQIGKQIIITKNILYITETSLNVTYNVSSTLYNSGDEDLSSINYIDTDISSVASQLNLTKANSKQFENTLLISKAASNINHEFALGTATIDSLNFYSNRPKINIPGYGGPADIIVYAPSSIQASASFDAAIEIKNVNPDIGQDFPINYWITNNDETQNFSSGQKTIYVGANSLVNTTIMQTSPSAIGIYKLKALAIWAGGSASAFESFDVVSKIIIEEPQESSSQSRSSSTTDSSVKIPSEKNESKPSEKQEAEAEIKEIICNPPYIRHGSECCLDQNNNGICDEDEKKDFKEAPKSDILASITGFIVNNITNIEIVNKIIIPIILIIIIILITLYIIKRIKKKPKDKKRLKTLINLKVYTSDGIEIGKVEEIFIKDHKIHSIKIKLHKKKKFKAKGIIISYKAVEAVKDIIIIKSNIIERI